MTIQKRYKHPQPTYRITLAGRDLTPHLSPFLQSLTLSEARSDEADQLDLVFNDEAGKLELPKKGVTLTLALGFKGEALVDKGTFIVDEVNWSGPPDIMTVRARSAELTSDLRRRRSHSWHDKSLGDIVRSIASRNGLTPRIDSELSAIKMGHLDQSGESDIAFVSRLARHFDAVATVKNGALLFLKINNTRTAGGEELPTITLHRNETQSYNYVTADRDSYTGVKAYYDDVKAAARDSVMVGSAGNLKELPDMYASKDDAEKSAKSEWQRIERSINQLSVVLATGKPDLMPQTNIQALGFKSDINAITWLAVKVKHDLTNGAGLITSVDMEMNSQKTDLGENKRSHGSGNSSGGFWGNSQEQEEEPEQE